MLFQSSPKRSTNTEPVRICVPVPSNRRDCKGAAKSREEMYTQDRKCKRESVFHATHSLSEPGVVPSCLRLGAIILEFSTIRKLLCETALRMNPMGLGKAMLQMEFSLCELPIPQNCEILGLGTGCTICAFVKRDCHHYILFLPLARILQNRRAEHAQKYFYKGDKIKIKFLWVPYHHVCFNLF